MTKNLKIEDWEKEFDERFSFLEKDIRVSPWQKTPIGKVRSIQKTDRAVKSFIRQLLKSEKEKLLKDLEGIGRNANGTFPVGFWDDVREKVIVEAIKKPQIKND